MKLCIVCNGTGWEKYKRPCQMYKGQAVDTVRRCRHCGGKGKVQDVEDGKLASAGK